MGDESLNTLLPKVQDTQLKQELEKQKSGYADFCQKIQAELQNHQAVLQEPSMMNKLMADMGVKMNAMKDKTKSHIADMMIQGSTMGISASTKGLHSCKNADPAVRKIAEDIVAFEQQNIEKMKTYL